MTENLAPDRLLALEGASNFRDVGGYPTADGGRVRWGMVFRSAALDRLTDADRQAIDRLGLRVVFDLRGDKERTRAPSALRDGLRCEVLPIGGTAGRTKELGELLLAGRLGDIPGDFLQQVYTALAEVAAPTYGRLLTGLADADGLPALIHCTAGKDRTGMAAALLLSVLGVDKETILDDYELSATHYTDRQMDAMTAKLSEAGITAEHYRRVFGAPRHAMDALLTALTERHGSIEGYLHDQAGVAPHVFSELRSRLVEPPDPEVPSGRG